MLYILKQREMMKHLFILTILCCFLTISNLCAAAPDLDNLLNIKNRGNNQETLYKGTPYVYIDFDENSNETPQKFEPLPYQPSYTFDIKTPFGQKTEASFVPHTTDFISKIQVLSNGDVIVDETLQFVNTRQDYLFERVVSKSNGADLIFVKATLDNRDVPLFVENNQNAWILKDSQVLSPGIHTYTLTYLLKEAIHVKGQIAELKLSLTGANWELPIERFSTVVLFPNKTPLFKNDVLFGANEINIPQSIDQYTDDKGNFFLTLNHPLPAYADIKINLDFDRKALVNEPFWDTFLNQTQEVLFLIGLGTILLYGFATILFLKYTKSTLYPLKELSSYSLLTLRSLAGYTLSHSFLRHLKKYYTYKNKTPLFFKLFYPLLMPGKLKSVNSYAAKLFVISNIMYKYVLTLTFIIGLIIWQAYRIQMPLSPFKIDTLICLAIISLYFIYHKGEKPFIKRQTTKFLDNAFNTDIGFGLSPSSVQALFVQFYPFMLALDQQKDWTNYIKQYNITFTGLTFLDEKETSL